MAAHPDQRAAAGHRPLRGVRGVRAAVALLALHEQDLVFGGFQDLRGLGHRRRVDPVLRIHEELAGLADRRADTLHFLQHALVHQRLRHMLADRRLVAVSPEIAGERLFADDVLAGLHRLDDHRAVQVGRRADVDDIDFAVGDQVAEAAVRGRNPVPAGKIDDVFAPGRDGPDFDIHAVDAPVGIHVQLGNEAAAGQADPDFRHSRMPPVAAVRTALYRTGGILHGPTGRADAPPTAPSRSAIEGKMGLGSPQYPIGGKPAGGCTSVECCQSMRAVKQAARAYSSVGPPRLRRSRWVSCHVSRTPFPIRASLVAI